MNQVVPKVNVSLNRSEKTSHFSLHLVTQSASTDFEDHLDHQTKELISHIHKAFKETLNVREIFFHDFQKNEFFVVG